MVRILNILLIGGSGTVGSAFANMLVSQNHSVFLIDRGSTGKKIQGAHHIIMDYYKVPVNALRDLVIKNNITVVVNFIVFKKEHAIKDFAIYNNIIKHYFFISTTMVYDRSLHLPKYTENSLLGNPYSEYARNKIECEQQFLSYFMNYGFPCTIIRPTDTYDERTLPFPIQGQYGIWQNILRIIEGKPHIIHDSGTSLWTLTNNYDFACGLYSLLQEKNTFGEVIQITSDDVLTWNEIYDYIACALNKKLIPYYIPSTILSMHGAPYDLEDTLIGDASNTSIFDNSKIIQYFPDYKTTKHFETEVFCTVQNILSNVQYHIVDPEFDNWCDHMVRNY